MSYRWLLFDADGTLFDYDAAEDAALEQSFAAHHLDFQPDYQLRYREINRQFWRRFEQKRVTAEALRTGRFRQLFAELGIICDAAAFANTYLAQLAQQAQLIDGAMELIQELNGRYHLALITNGLADVQYPRLERSRLQSYFSAVIVSDEVGVAKPNPAIFNEAFHRMGNPTKAEVLIIGDSLSSDMTGGCNYGIATCWYNPNGLHASPNLPITYEIRRLAELTNII